MGKGLLEFAGVFDFNDTRGMTPARLFLAKGRHVLPPNTCEQVPEISTRGPPATGKLHFPHLLVGVIENDLARLPGKLAEDEVLRRHGGLLSVEVTSERFGPHKVRTVRQGRQGDAFDDNSGAGAVAFLHAQNKLCVFRE